MSDYPVFWILLCAVVSIGWAGFQYFFRARRQPYRWVLALLRGLGVFGLLLLVVNPRMERLQTRLQKHQLYVLFDNSRSIDSGNARNALLHIREDLSADPGLQERFDMLPFRFGGQVQVADTIDFSAEESDITQALNEVYRASVDRPSSILLLSDGNQTSGQGYAFATKPGRTVIPVILGDTSRYQDLRIDRLNVNRYAFQGNRYPVEVLFSYAGISMANSVLEIRDNGRLAHRVPVLLGNRETQRVSVLLPAESAGFHRIEAQLQPLPQERNIRNNLAVSGLEVLEDRLDIKLVTTQNHPDMGALRRSLSRKEERSFQLMPPAQALEELEGTDLLILYLPDAAFTPLLEAATTRNIPVWIITGPETDWMVLNQAQDAFFMDEPGPEEALYPLQDGAFDYFDPGGWPVTEFPPLEGILGQLIIQRPYQTLLGQRVRGIPLGEPLVALLKDTPRQVLWLGTGLWKWRAATYRINGSFEAFDVLMGKILRFLTAEGAGSRLTLEYEPVFAQSATSYLRARYFDETFAFDPGARLTIRLEPIDGGQERLFPMALRGELYEVNVTGLSPGEYNFTVTEAGSGIAQSGRLAVTETDVERLQQRPDTEMLGTLAANSGGRVYYQDQWELLKDSLLRQERYQPRQKTQRNVVSLIDFRWLLAAVVACLGLEWIIRKYNGNL